MSDFLKIGLIFYNKKLNRSHRPVCAYSENGFNHLHDKRVKCWSISVTLVLPTFFKKISFGDITFNMTLLNHSVYNITWGTLHSRNCYRNSVNRYIAAVCSPCSHLASDTEVSAAEPPDYRGHAPHPQPSTKNILNMV